MTAPIAPQLVKVNFDLDARDWHGSGSETLWASHVSTDPVCRRLRLENSPFYVTGISFRDVVKARPTENPIVFEFEEVIARGGHSTYMILVTEGEELDSPAFLAHWDLLKQKGCSCESTHERYPTGSRLLLSVDVPPSVDLFETCKILERGQAIGLWLFQEGSAHLPRRQS